LRPEYREVIVLRHQEGLAYEEIAEIAGLPLGTVKTYIHRARKELAALLAAAGWGPGRGGRNPGPETVVGCAR
jgi:RNA polymerase sigma-70 factor (ECF subfamily)